jgi:hypothetical protein
MPGRQNSDFAFAYLLDQNAVFNVYIGIKAV